MFTLAHKVTASVLCFTGVDVDKLDEVLPKYAVQHAQQPHWSWLTDPFSSGHCNNCFTFPYLLSVFRFRNQINMTVLSSEARKATYTMRHAE
jgi:hypothetical protein